MRRFNVMLLVAALAVIWSVGSASADPLKNPNAFVFENLDCDNGQTVTIVTASNYAASGQIIDETGVLIFRSGTITVRDANNPSTVLEVIPFSIGKGKKTGLQGDLVTCTTTEFGTHPETGQAEQVDYEFIFTFVPRGQNDSPSR